MAAFRQSSRQALAEVASLLPPQVDGTDTTNKLRVSLDSYWQLFEPLFYWTPAEKRERSAAFVRTEVLLRREEVLGLAREIEALNDSSLDVQRGEIVARRAEYQQGLRNLLWQTLLVGLIVTLVAVNRLRVLERRAD